MYSLKVYIIIYTVRGWEKPLKVVLFDVTYPEIQFLYFFVTSTIYELTVTLCK